MGDTVQALFGPANRFGAFLASTDQKANIGRHMAAIFNGLIKADVLKNPLTFIDVGCGEGELIVPVYGKLLETGKVVQLVAVDPSSTMTDALKTRLSAHGLAGHVVTDKFFDHSTGQVPEAALVCGRGDIVLCSHAIYYAADVDRACDQMLSSVSDQGILIGVHQSKNSQMHRLRNSFSHASIRYPGDGEPIVADHMENRIATVLKRPSVPRCVYNSSLYFENDTSAFIQDFIDFLEGDEGPEAFMRLVERYGDTATRGRNVLEFILREDLFKTERTVAIEFLEAAKKMIDDNARDHTQRPRIIITESISFASSDAGVDNALSRFAHAYQADIV